MCILSSSTLPHGGVGGLMPYVARASEVPLTHPTNNRWQGRRRRDGLCADKLPKAIGLRRAATNWSDTCNVLTKTIIRSAC